jgi:photosystem II stability/assembly factor-like uncharacterized protein
MTDGNTAVAVGDNTTIIRTTNGGLIWTPVTVGTPVTLLGLHFDGRDRAMAVGVDGVLLQTPDGGISWTLLTTGTRLPLYAVSSPEPLTTVVAGYRGMIMRSENGGLSWVSQGSGMADDLKAIAFSSASTGIAAGDGGEIGRTTDGGALWATESFSAPNRIVHFSGASLRSSGLGLVVGKMDSAVSPIETRVRSMILRTTNHGATWARREPEREDGQLAELHFFDVSFADESTVVFVGDSGIIFRSTDAGLNWSEQVSGTTVKLMAVSMGSSLNGVAVGEYGTILHTVDGGIGWNLQQTVPAKTYWDVCMVDATTGIAVGADGMAVRTTDGGSSWVPMASKTTNALRGISFSNPNTGTMVGTGGSILRTTTGGLPVSVETLHSPAVPLAFRLEQNYPNPFNGTTSIAFSLRSSDRVTLAVYDALGKRVALLLDDTIDRGAYRIQFNAGHLASGVYFYRLSAGSHQATRKLLLLK